MDDGTEMSTSQETHPPSHSDDSNGHSSPTAHPDNTPCLPANQPMLQEQDIHTSSTPTGTQLVCDKNEHQTSPHSPSLASSNTSPTPPSTQYFLEEETLVVTEQGSHSNSTSNAPKASNLNFLYFNARSCYPKSTS